MSAESNAKLCNDLIKKCNNRIIWNYQIEEIIWTGKFIICRVNLKVWFNKHKTPIEMCLKMATHPSCQCLISYVGPDGLNGKWIFSLTIL